MLINLSYPNWSMPCVLRQSSIQHWGKPGTHYSDVIMTTIASQITRLTVVYSTVYSDADQRKHRSSTSLAFVRGIHRNRWIPRWKGQLRGKCFHLMTPSWHANILCLCHMAKALLYHLLIMMACYVLSSIPYRDQYWRVFESSMRKACSEICMRWGSFSFKQKFLCKCLWMIYCRIVQIWYNS